MRPPFGWRSQRTLQTREPIRGSSPKLPWLDHVGSGFRFLAFCLITNTTTASPWVRAVVDVAGLGRFVLFLQENSTTTKPIPAPLLNFLRMHYWIPKGPRLTPKGHVVCVGGVQVVYVIYSRTCGDRWRTALGPCSTGSTSSRTVAPNWSPY